MFLFDFTCGTLLWLAAQFLLSRFFRRRFYMAGAVTVVLFPGRIFYSRSGNAELYLVRVFIALLLIDIIFVFAFGKSARCRQGYVRPHEQRR